MIRTLAIGPAALEAPDIALLYILSEPVGLACWGHTWQLLGCIVFNI
jgi:hypothetical protein